IFEIPVLVLITIPSASTRLIVASLYSLPLMVLKSSASASDAERSGKIASVVAQSFTCGAFCLFCSPHGNDKIDFKRSRLGARRSRLAANGIVCDTSLVARKSRVGAVSSVVEHLVYTERVGGSKPSPPSLIFDFRFSICD